MTTFTTIYNRDIMNLLTLYENDKRYVNENTIRYRLELEFNEERGIELELFMKNNEVIDTMYVFYQIVYDAQFAYHHEDIKDYYDLQDYVECKLGAKKLCFLVGEDMFHRLINCQMDYRV